MLDCGLVVVIAGAAKTPMPLKYTPKYQETVIEPVTTANKNIQSFFMRTDRSYYVPEMFRYPQYCSQDAPSLVVIDDGYTAVYKTAAEKIGEEREGVLVGCRFDTDGTGKCRDKLYSIIRSQIGDRLVPRDSFVQLLFCDFLPRPDLVDAIDILLNEIGFKGIMVLPLSLSASFALGQGYCAFAYPHGFSFVDDFMLADSFRMGEAATAPHRDTEDFVEEFTRLRALDDAMRYSCDTCGLKESTEERIKSHVGREHEGGTYFHYVPGATPSEAFENRLRFLFAEERAAKIRQCVYSVGTEFGGATPVDGIHSLAVRGADLFRRLECSKECWMTDREWQAVGLRVLKEKLLFFI